MNDVVTPNGHAEGSVAQTLLANGFSVNALKPMTDAGKIRRNAVLRKDEWIAFDEAVVEVAQERLRGIQDLISAGLTFNVPNAMGTTQVEWEEASDLTPADVSMDGVRRSQNDRQEFDLNSIPLPITHKDFYLNLRSLEASRSRGSSLDTTQVERCTRNVSEKLEDILFNGLSGYTVGGATVRGYTDFPGRSTYTIPTAWNSLTDTSTQSIGEQIQDDVLSKIDKAKSAKYFGPYVLYVPQNYETTLMKDYKKEVSISTAEKLRQMESISDVKVVDQLSDNNVVLVQMTRDVVDLVMGQEPTTVQWDTEGGFRLNFKVMSIMVPRLKQDFEGNCGIVHGSTS